MSQEDLRALAVAVDGAVRAVPGVVALYRPGTLVGNAVARVAALAGDAGDAVLSDVTVRDGELHVTASIGVASTAAETCRMVHDAVAHAMSARRWPEATVHLTVANVAG